MTVNRFFCFLFSRLVMRCKRFVYLSRDLHTNKIAQKIKWWCFLFTSIIMTFFWMTRTIKLLLHRNVFVYTNGFISVVYTLVKRLNGLSSRNNIIYEYSFQLLKLNNHPLKTMNRKSQNVVQRKINCFFFIQFPLIFDLLM